MKKLHDKEAKADPWLNLYTTTLDIKPMERVLCWKAGIFKLALI